MQYVLWVQVLYFVKKFMNYFCAAALPQQSILYASSIRTQYANTLAVITQLSHLEISKSVPFQTAWAGLKGRSARGCTRLAGTQT